MFNKCLATVLPFFPKPVIGLFARRYVAGETETEALAIAKYLNSQYFRATMDILGEHTRSREAAEAVTNAYIHLFQSIGVSNIDSTVSVKLTHIGLDVGESVCEYNLFRILEEARAQKNSLCIDMENSPLTDTTLALYKKCLEIYPEGVSTALQAYMHRSHADLLNISGPDLRVRICKGIYKESPDIAIQEREKINTHFFDLVQTILNGQGFVSIATHDIPLIDTITAFIEENKIPSERFEFQTLYGVPMRGKLTELMAKGYTVRIYLPYGTQWHSYSMRRLKENPAIVSYVLSNLFRRS